MRTLATGLALFSLLACGGDDDGGTEVPDASGPTVDAGADAAATLGTCEGIDTDAGLMPGAAFSPGCDLSGVWVARQTAQSLALGVLPQFANTWLYYELRQTGSTLEVTQHLDCGAEVRGTVTVQLTPQTTNALREHNRQLGRRGSVTPSPNGRCAVSIERFWSVRGVSETAYLPTPRSREASLEQLKSELPLPAADMPGGSQDWDGDGKPGVAWNISGNLTGTRHSAQRDWTRYFTAPGYEVTAAEDFRQDLVVRAAYAMEEVVYAVEGGESLRQIAQPACAAPHTLTLRFLGRTRDDARAKAVLGADDATTCANVRAALPAVAALR